VGQVRLNATMTQNVVTYTIEVDTDNSDGRLLPYLTANAMFEIGRRSNVLLVPNEALRWTPKAGQVAPGAHAGPDRPGRRDQGGAGTLWIEAGKRVRPLQVTAGLTDGSFTEVAGQDLAEGLRVVYGEGPREAGTAQAERNPFAPPRFPGQRGGQGQGQAQAEPGQGEAAPGHGR
jgi:HlyD family secretion protein